MLKILFKCHAMTATVNPPTKCFMPEVFKPVLIHKQVFLFFKKLSCKWPMATPHQIQYIKQMYTLYQIQYMLFNQCYFPIKLLSDYFNMS